MAFVQELTAKHQRYEHAMAEITQKITSAVENETSECACLYVVHSNKQALYALNVFFYASQISSCLRREGSGDHFLRIVQRGTPDRRFILLNNPHSALWHLTSRLCPLSQQYETAVSPCSDVTYQSRVPIC